jgi:hypothetical protein
VQIISDEIIKGLKKNEIGLNKLHAAPQLCMLLTADWRQHQTQKMVDGK